MILDLDCEPTAYGEELWLEARVKGKVETCLVVVDMLLYSQSYTPYFIEIINTHKWYMHGQSFSMFFVDVIRKDVHIHLQPC